MKFCDNCGNQLNDSAIFCPKCGSKVEVADVYSYSTERSSSHVDEATSSLLNTMRKTGSSQFVKLGKNRNLFITVSVALIFNLILMLCPTMNLSALSLLNTSFTLLGSLSAAKEWVGDNGALDFFMAIAVIGLIVLILSIVVIALAFLFSKQYRAAYLTLAKVATIYTLVVNVIFIIVLAAAVGSTDGLGGFSLTAAGWLYIIESIVTIALLFMLSARLKKNRVPSVQYIS